MEVDVIEHGSESQILEACSTETADLLLLSYVETETRVCSATRSPSPTVQYAQLNAATFSNEPHLIVLSVHVDGASRPLRVLMNSGATNNVVRAKSLPVLPSWLRVCKSSGGMIVRNAEERPRTHQQRLEVLSYRFDAFRSRDAFQVVDLSGSFDCISGMPWIARHRPDIDWLNHTIQPRDIDVNAVLDVLKRPKITWHPVAVVDPDSTTDQAAELYDGPSSVVCHSTACSLSVKQCY
ncbi:unnamed protein product [Peronospora belbahrii]|uniref:Uncharacterized protein n=1 Tax=Peronospora belbahrii TaxID=622444 RepID=A0AAU9KJA6_9STRA|nr:unnamed protein product [Peronospora belbahrii]